MRISLWNRIRRALGLPYKVVVHPAIPASEIMALRAHIDEAKNDPDYAVIGWATRQQEIEQQNFSAFKH